MNWPAVVIREAYAIDRDIGTGSKKRVIAAGGLLWARTSVAARSLLPAGWNQRNHPNGHAVIASITMHSSMEASK